ncbi:MAG: glycosyltransferase family 1 protein [Patescibacteria group bacterium]
MIIAFNLIPYTEVNGLQIFAANLLEHLQIGPEDRLLLFTNQKSSELFKDLNPRAEMINKNFPRLSRFQLALYQQLSFNQALKKEKVDVLFCPSLALPLFWRKKIVTIHDLAFLRYREESSGGIFRLYLKLALWSAKYFSLGLAAISEFSRQEIVDLMRVPKEKIAIISRGAPEFPEISETEEIEVLNKFQLLSANRQPKKYWLYLGAGYYRKNLDRLLEAFRLFLVDNGDEAEKYYLVIAGKQDEGIRKIASLVKEDGAWSQFSSQIIFTGFITENEKQALIKNALALAFVSLYEGFGLPPLEAQALNTPVLGGNSSSIPEICGQGAYLVDPKNIPAIKESLSLISSDDKLRQELISRGQKNLEHYSWTQVAQDFNSLIHRYDH